MKLDIIMQALPCYLNSRVSLFQHGGYMTSDTEVKLNKINHLNAELNPICYLLALLGAHHIFHVGR